MLNDTEFVSISDLTWPGQFDVFNGVPLVNSKPWTPPAVDEDLTATTWVPDGPCWS